MRFPQVSERVKEAPAHALRAVFASIGQVLLVTDRMKNKPAEEEKAAGPRADERAEEAAATATPPAAPRKTTAAETTTAGPTPTAKAPASAAPKTAAETGKRTAKAPAAESPAVNRGTQTGNVRLLPDAGSAPAADALGAPAAETLAAPAAEAARAATEPAATESAPVIANYEQLTITSLHARLRGLTITQVRELIVYERAHADRPDVISMFERRVTRLETPEG